MFQDYLDFQPVVLKNSSFKFAIFGIIVTTSIALSEISFLITGFAFCLLLYTMFNFYTLIGKSIYKFINYISFKYETRLIGDNYGTI